MKAIKYADKVLLYIDETASGMQKLIEKYIEGEYEIISVIPCPICQGGWVEQKKEEGNE